MTEKLEWCSFLATRQETNQRNVQGVALDPVSSPAVFYNGRAVYVINPNDTEPKTTALCLYGDFVRKYKLKKTAFLRTKNFTPAFLF